MNNNLEMKRQLEDLKVCAEMINDAIAKLEVAFKNAVNDAQVASTDTLRPVNRSRNIPIERRSPGYQERYQKVTACVKELEAAGTRTFNVFELHAVVKKNEIDLAPTSLYNYLNDMADMGIIVPGRKGRNLVYTIIEGVRKWN